MRAVLILLNIDTRAPVHHVRAMEIRSIQVLRQRPASSRRMGWRGIAAFKLRRSAR
jgi:hypothetical protein